MWDLRRWYNRHGALASQHVQLIARIWTSQNARASKLLCTLVLLLDCEFPGLVQPSRDAFSRPGLAWPCGATVLFYYAALVASISECPNEILRDRESEKQKEREIEKGRVSETELGSIIQRQPLQRHEHMERWREEERE
jgi:hypothetical protein